MERENSNSITKNIILILGSVLIIFGTVFFIIGISIFVNERNFISRGEEVEAEISDINAFGSSGRNHHNVYVTFEYEGKEYSNVYLNTYLPGMHEGDSIEIICDPDDPSKITTKGSSILFLVVFSGIGGVFLIVGISILVCHFHNQGNIKYLLKNGMKISGVITEMSRDMKFEINGVHPFRIYCEYTDPTKNLRYRFKSKLLSFDPNDSYHIGDSIDIYVNPNDWRKNYVNAIDKCSGRIIDLT